MPPNVGVTCSLLPTAMRELAAEWHSSGTVAEYDFGDGLVTALNINTDVEIVSGSLDTRMDSLALDYQTAFAFGPVETGSTVSGSVFKAWRAQNFYNTASMTGTVWLSRENDAGDNWRDALPLFEYSGSEIKEIDLTFDQSARAVISGDRNYISGGTTQSAVWLYRFSTLTNSTIFTAISTGSNPRVIIDEPNELSESDVLAFYVKSYTSEFLPEFIHAQGSLVENDPTSSYCNEAITLSLSPYHVCNGVLELGVFSSRATNTSSLSISGSFNTPVQAVGAVIVDPDNAGNVIIAYDEDDNELQRKQFVYDGLPRTLTKDTQILTASGDFGTGSTLIKRFILIPAQFDYVSYDAILFKPTGACQPGTFSVQNVFYRQQRDNYLIERPIPLTEVTFLEAIDFIYGLFTGTFDYGEATLTGRLFPTGVASGTIVGTWSFSTAILTLNSGVFSGSLTGSGTGSFFGVVSGAMSGTLSGTHGTFEGELSGTTSQSFVAEATFLYELFLEDAVKLTDSRVALYVSRRNVDSSSAYRGEYRSNKVETVLYPIRTQEDQYSASVDLYTSSLFPVLQTTLFDKDAIFSMSGAVPSGSHSLQTIIVTHSIFDKEAVFSMSGLIPSGSHSLTDLTITHSIFDKEAIFSMSGVISEGAGATQTLEDLLLIHTAFDKEAFVSMSMTVVSGSLEVV